MDNVSQSLFVSVIRVSYPTSAISLDYHSPDIDLLFALFDLEKKNNILRLFLLEKAIVWFLPHTYTCTYTQVQQWEVSVIKSADTFPKLTQTEKILLLQHTFLFDEKFSAIKR